MNNVAGVGIRNCSYQNDYTSELRVVCYCRVSTEHDGRILKNPAKTKGKMIALVQKFYEPVRQPVLTTKEVHKKALAKVEARLRYFLAGAGAAAGCICICEFMFA